MLPRLPAEILRLIVDNFRLPLFSTYRRTLELEDETRATLYVLCLTSHTLRLIAQPLLYEFVRIENDGQLSQLIESTASSNRLHLIKAVVLERGWVHHRFPVDSPILSRFFRGIDQLIVHGGFSHCQCFSGSSTYTSNLVTFHEGGELTCL